MDFSEVMQIAENLAFSLHGLTICSQDTDVFAIFDHSYAENYWMDTIFFKLYLDYAAQNKD